LIDLKPAAEQNCDLIPLGLQCVDPMPAILHLLGLNWQPDNSADPQYCSDDFQQDPLLEERDVSDQIHGHVLDATSDTTFNPISAKVPPASPAVVISEENLSNAGARDWQRRGLCRDHWQTL
jgi:hypothetical protein